VNEREDESEKLLQVCRFERIIVNTTDPFMCCASPCYSLLSTLPLSTTLAFLINIGRAKKQKILLGLGTVWRESREEKPMRSIIVDEVKENPRPPNRDFLRSHTQEHTCHLSLI